MSRAEVQIDDAVIVINIHQQFPFAQNAEELKECTRGLWRLDTKRGERAKYLFGVYKGEIKEVYEIRQCIPARKETKDYWRKRLLSQGKDLSPSINDDRSEFDVRTAPEDIRRKYVGKRMAVRLTQNPVRYFNC
jgi:hypothetical protein